VGLSLVLGEVEDDRLVIEVEGSFHDSKVIALELGPEALSIMDPERLLLLFDGELAEAAEPGDVLTATGSDSVYCFLDWKEGLQLLVYIPHFSAHTITVATDKDMDRSADYTDAFPEDPAASLDSDGDGYPDRWNEGRSGEDSTTGLKIDEYPDDDRKWKSEALEQDPAWLSIILSVAGIAAIVVVIIVIAVVLYSRKRERYYEDYLASEDVLEDEVDRVVPGTSKKDDWDEFFYED